MFQLFKKKVVCSVPEPIREWMGAAFVWLRADFGDEVLLHKKVFVPHFSDFPIQYDGQKEAALKTLEIVAKQMDVVLDNIVLEIYSEGETEINTGSLFGDKLYINQEKGAGRSGGLYWGKDETDGKYHIGLEMKALSEPEKIVATLAHEIAHIKLLGEGRLDENNEHLTDLTTILFGFGIFNANAAFTFRKDSNSWGYSKLGYFTQSQWAYALALQAYLRGEYQPEWIKYLALDIKADFKNNIQFMLQNEDKLFVQDK
jgi:hypothetical protein